MAVQIAQHFHSLAGAVDCRLCLMPILFYQTLTGWFQDDGLFLVHEDCCAAAKATEVNHAAL